MKQKTKFSARITARHGYQVLVTLAAELPASSPTDLPSIPFEMNAAGHRLAAALWLEANEMQPRPRWAIDVSYAQVEIELVEGENVHLAASVARACAARVGLDVAGAAIGPKKAQPIGRAPKASKRRASR